MTHWARTAARLRRNSAAVAGGAALVTFSVLGALVPILGPYSPSGIDLGHVLAPPSWAHPLGTDELGRDVVTCLLAGGRVSLLAGVGAMTIATTIGIAYGSIAGYRGGLVDVLMMRAVDFLLAFPAVFVLLVVASFGRVSLLSVTLYLGLLGWMEIARLVRAQVLSLRELDFVIAARSAGARSARIVLRHLVPNSVGPVIVAATLGVAAAMLAEAALDFLGLGLPPDIPSWGNEIAAWRLYATTAPALAVAPGLAITAVLLSLTAIGHSLRDAADPLGG